MEKVTDIDMIKRASMLFLEMPIEVDKNFDFICHHPFIKDTYTVVPCEKTKENPVGVEMMDVRVPEKLEIVKEHFSKAINNCNKASDFFIIINKPYSGIFFKIIKEYLSIEDYTNLLELLWTSMEYPNSDVNVSQREFVNYWSKVDTNYIYSDEDKKIIEDLPEEFYVYRGLMERANVKALSWTLDKNTAIWFAKRWDYNGKVYRAKCKKKDILAYLSCRNESEIVVDWHNLENIEEINYEK